MPSAARAQADRAASIDPERARLDALLPRLSRLSEDLLRFWLAHGPDREHGGFHGTLDRAGDPKAPTDKGLIQEARHLWVLSIWHERENQPDTRALADDLYHFIEDHYRDESGEYHFKVTREGAVAEGKKVLYAQAFVIFALSEYSRAFGVPEALQHALDCFFSIDRRAHDAQHGGYDQRRDPAWLSPEAEKETNTHLHLLEAFTTLYQVSKDETVRARLEELVTVFSNRVIQPQGYAQQEFLLDWTPLGPPVVSYGHDIETAWLLLEAAGALGRSDDPRIQRAALRVGTLSATEGFDASAGGYFESGPLGGPPDHTEKIWWIQAEALLGLFRLYRLDPDPKMLERLERTLGFIETHLFDPKHGEWYWGVAPDGSLGPKGDDKGSEWKASYHALRATLFLQEWIRQGDRP